MNFDRNVSCLIAVYTLMDNDFFNQAVKGGCVQLRDVGVFLNGLHPPAGVAIVGMVLVPLLSGLFTV